MITSSNFFTKNMFNAQDEPGADSNQFGPWLISKQRKFATLDVSKRSQNKSENRYHSKKHSEPPYSIPKAQISIASHSNLQHQKQHQSDISTKITRLKQRGKNESFLPEISSIKKRFNKLELVDSRQSYSPLAFQLNFITKKQQRKNRHLKYLSDYSPEQKAHCFDTVQKYLYQNNPKYNIYEKCVVEIKRNSSKSKQL